MLDVGAGIGVIGLELLAAGAAAVTSVDAARAHVAVGQHEIERRRLTDRATFHLGDFVALAQLFEPADIVTLHRVVCCYGDWTALVDASADARGGSTASSIPTTDGGRGSRSAAAI